MIINRTSIDDVLLIENPHFDDNRGYFSEVFRHNELEDFLNRKINFVQINESFSYKNVLRGLHFQEPNPQAKLIKIVSGEVFDVAVDLRPNSKTYLQYVGVTLSAQKNEMLFIPEGFAHGFFVTGDHARCIYFCNNYYSRNDAKTINYKDTRLNIKWPFNGNTPILSTADENAMFVDSL